MLTVLRRLCGQVAGGPSAVLDQSSSRMRAPISPPPWRKVRLEVTSGVWCDGSRIDRFAVGWNATHSVDAGREGRLNARERGRESIRSRLAPHRSTSRKNEPARRAKSIRDG